MDRSRIEPIQDTIPDQRQKLARHYGVHPYFTRRSANVVRAYIDRFSFVGDTVVDPFGGSGVTAIEAMLLGRRGVHNDINPFANFLTSVIGDTTGCGVEGLRHAFQDVAAECESVLEQCQTESEADIQKRLRKLPLPTNIPLPRSSDAETYRDLFTPRQLAGLALLKQSIDAVSPKGPREALLLAWSATLAKVNRTFISTTGRAASRGGSSIFSIYRYKLAKSPVELPVWETFAGRFENVVRARQEVLQARDVFNSTHLAGEAISSSTHLSILRQDAADLTATLGRESVDFVFTDPPYGGYIAYLDLSILWNHWLGFHVSDRQRHDEAIVGGDLKLSEDHYRQKLADSIRACARLLRPDRWMSVVFQHWDVEYFRTILEAAASAGAELRAAVTQERDVVWSMHKKKNKENLLAGEMILTFYKPSAPGRVDRVADGGNALFCELLDAALRDCGSRPSITSQFVFNRMILAAWHRRSLHQLNVARETLAEGLRQRGWAYDGKRHVWVQGAVNGELFS